MKSWGKPLSLLSSSLELEDSLRADAERGFPQTPFQNFLGHTAREGGGVRIRAMAAWRVGPRQVEFWLGMSLAAHKFDDFARRFCGAIKSFEGESRGETFSKVSPLAAGGKRERHTQSRESGSGLQ
jgi:hypothetical protein